MMKEIRDCGTKGDARKISECCFHVADRYWSTLRNEVAEYQFKTPEEEIAFFKTIKPKFTSEIEYYSLVYHMSIHLPHDPVKLEYAWAREAGRLRKFIRKNRAFYNYCTSGCTSIDSQYFIRKNNDLSTFTQVKVYDADCRAATSHDSLVASILALERYHRYAEEQLQLIREKK